MEEANIKDLIVKPVLKDTGENYADWAFELKLNLTNFGLWDATLDQPVEDILVFSAIFKSVSDGLKSVIRTNSNVSPSSVAAWKLLNSRPGFGTKSIIEGVSAIKDLVNFKFSSSETLSVTFDKANALESIMTTAFGSNSITLKQLVQLFILVRLPSSFDNFVQNFLLNMTTLEALDGVQSGAIDASKSMRHPESHIRVNSASTLCPHQRPRTGPRGCWTCDPSLRPECSRCKGTREKYYHTEAKCPFIDGNEGTTVNVSTA